MRDLIFKNLTFPDKKRKIIASSEVMDNKGVRSTIRRHFIWIAKEIKDKPISQPLPSLYVRKLRDHKGQREEFFCRMKSSVYANCAGKEFLIFFMHSLKINLMAIPKHFEKTSLGNLDKGGKT